MDEYERAAAYIDSAIASLNADIKHVRQLVARLERFAWLSGGAVGGAIVAVVVDLLD